MTTHVEKKSALSFELASLSVVMENALESCAKRLGMDGRAKALGAMHQGECFVCEQMRYDLAKGLAAYLGSMDATVKAVYAYEPEYATSADEALPEGPRRTPAINLIVWADRKSAALQALQDALSATMAQDWSALGCPKASKLCSTLDIQVVDDAEVQAGSGYGAVIQSLYVRPLEVWRR